MNLLLNAADALAGRPGKIWVRVREVARSADELHELAVDASEGPGRFLELVVRDEGCGMSPETVRRIFDPFFSTKFQGRGLGLATVLGIVRGHAGAIGVESTLGEGTRFCLLFPLAHG
jgi:signal transduction histidine kinase